MSNLSFIELVDEYITCAKINHDIDYANKNAVRKANKAVDRMIEISKIINKEYPSMLCSFAELLKYDKYRIDAWVAHHLLENMNYSVDLEIRALDVIIKYSKSDTVNGLGNRMWLEQWYDKKNNYKITQ